eukprot:scaffold4150_cov117-Cylindrotheca_fusiformis.AAC.6
MERYIEKRKKRTFAALNGGVQKTSLEKTQSRQEMQKEESSQPSFHCSFPPLPSNLNPCSSAEDEESCAKSYSRSLSGSSGSSCSSLSNSDVECSTPQSDEPELSCELTSLPRIATGTASAAADSKRAAVDRKKRTSLFLLSSDTMAGVLSFLEPVEVLEVVASPLCKDWCQCFTYNSELWRVLCSLEPFNHKNQDNSNWSDDDDSSYCTLGSHPVDSAKMGRHRLMYTSFVRCMKYLNQIKEDAREGRPLNRNQQSPFGSSRDLKNILAGRNNLAAKRSSLSKTAAGVWAVDRKKKPATKDEEPCKKKPKFGKSMITARLLGPSSQGKPSHMNLPQSCAIFSIANWMVAYPEVEGIQTLCIETLPSLLEDERQRLTAQRANLAESVIKAMVSFPNKLRLHIAAMHTLVLLGRPLGGQEGMLIDLMERPLPSSGLALMNSAKGGRMDGVGRINIVLESMRRFEHEEKLQAMACWAFVNLALVPAQKSILLKLGGIGAILNALRQHPRSLSVQFRGLFALINFSIPCKDKPSHQRSEAAANSMLAPSPQKSEKEILDGHVGEIVNRVVAAVHSFASSRSIRNRACLILHNISLSHEYIPTLMWTKRCYKMLSWCLTHDTSDPILCRSALGALGRIQHYLSSNESLQTRFANWLLLMEQQEELPTLSLVNDTTTERGVGGTHL